MRQWGYPALSLLGTGARPDQIDDLRRFGRTYLVLDNDDAGIEATLLLQEAIGPTAVAVALPEGVKDPAELATRPDGQALFAAALLESVGGSPAGSSDSRKLADGFTEPHRSSSTSDSVRPGT